MLAKWCWSQRGVLSHFRKLIHKHKQMNKILFSSFILCIISKMYFLYSNSLILFIYFILFSYNVFILFLFIILFYFCYHQVVLKVWSSETESEKSFGGWSFFLIHWCYSYWWGRSIIIWAPITDVTRCSSKEEDTPAGHTKIFILRPLNFKF